VILVLPFTKVKMVSALLVGPSQLVGDEILYDLELDLELSNLYKIRDRADKITFLA
jgi:hypothetical protein